jgi:hypothetical protein
MFRDQSKTIITKLRSKSSRILSIDQVFPSSTASVAPESVASPVIYFAPAIPLDLTTSADHQATAFFFHNFVPERTLLPYGSFNYLQDIFARDKVDQAICDGISALGFAGLSNLWQDPTIMNAATIKYTSALERTRSRLANCDDAKSDQTFAAVKLLAAYEVCAKDLYISVYRVLIDIQTNACYGANSTKAWSQHAAGASALMKHRGKAQLETRLGREMFIQQRVQIVSIPTLDLRTITDDLDRELLAEKGVGTEIC